MTELHLTTAEPVETWIHWFASLVFADHDAGDKALSSL
jgi:hypothetical protein